MEGSDDTRLNISTCLFGRDTWAMASAVASDSAQYCLTSDNRAPMCSPVSRRS